MRGTSAGRGRGIGLGLGLGLGLGFGFGLVLVAPAARPASSPKMKDAGPSPAAMLIYAVVESCETRQVRRAAAMGRLDTRVGAALL